MEERFLGRLVAHEAWPDMTAAVVLQNRQVIHTCDLDEARYETTRYFSPHRLDAVCQNSRPDIVVNAARLRNVTVAYLHHGVEVRVDPGELTTYYDVNIPLSGSWLTVCGSQEAVGDTSAAAVLDATQPVRMRWSADCALLAVRIERPALEECLAQLLDRSVRTPIHPDLTMDLTRGSARAWVRIVQALAADLDEDDSLADNPLAAEPFEHLIMTKLLLAQPHNYSHELASPRPPARPRSVKRAIEFMESCPQQAMTVADVAAASGASVRSLQEGFAQYVGVSPMTYLRDVRLARAHAEFARTDPASGVTVTEIALRWGFTHPARFAALYRERYGLPPAQALRA